MRKIQVLIFALALGLAAFPAFAQSKAGDNPQYKLLATRRTSTMQKEIDEVSAQGYRILVGSPTSSTEMAVFLSREGTVENQFKYKLLATARTGTMQKELNDMAADGYRLIPSTMIAKSGMISLEIVMILEKPPGPRRLLQHKVRRSVNLGLLERTSFSMGSRQEQQRPRPRATMSKYRAR